MGGMIAQEACSGILSPSAPLRWHVPRADRFIAQRGRFRALAGSPALADAAGRVARTIVG